jgi:TonB family protein
MTKVAIILLALLVGSEVRASTTARKPTVIVNLNDNKGLTSTPVPGYPKEALKNGWSGIGLFQLHFAADGSVSEVETLISTDHQLLDETARTALAQWRCQPHAHRAAMITMSFRAKKADEPVSLKNESEGKANFVFAAHPSYPLEARRLRVIGAGIFMLHFRLDGIADKVVPIRSTGSPILDRECISTFLRWRCVPGAIRAAYVPINFTMNGYR